MTAPDPKPQPAPDVPEPFGYVVVTFMTSSDREWCDLTRCPMGAEWFATRDAAERRVDELPDWCAPHILMGTRNRTGQDVVTSRHHDATTILADTLRLIAGERCENFFSRPGDANRWQCFLPGSGRTRISTTGTADQWCDACRARDALVRAGVTERCERCAEPIERHGEHWIHAASGRDTPCPRACPPSVEGQSDAL